MSDEGKKKPDGKVETDEPKATPWRSLERRFVVLQPVDADGLRAEYLSSGYPPKGARWILRGAPDGATHRQFVTAARAGARLAGRPATLQEWLYLLKRESETR